MGNHGPRLSFILRVPAVRKTPSYLTSNVVLINEAHIQYYSACLSTRIPDRATSSYETYRDTTLTTICGIPGALLAGYLASTKLGRKYTMLIGAFCGMALFFGLTGIRTYEQNVGLSCTICKIIIIWTTPPPPLLALM
jgi:hypothetical protein